MLTVSIDQALCRTYLSDVNETEVFSRDISRCEMKWFQIRGITDFNKDMTDDQYRKIFQAILGGCMIPACQVGFLVLGSAETGIRFFMGTTDDREVFDAFRCNCMAMLPGLEISEDVCYQRLAVGKQYGGVVVGLPDSMEKEETVSDSMPIDRLCRSMRGREFSILIIAERQPEVIVNWAMDKTDHLLMQNSCLLTTNRVSETGLQITYNNVVAERYQKNLERLQELLYDSSQNGLWKTSVFFSCAEKGDVSILKNGILSNYGGVSGGRYEPVRCIDMKGDMKFLNDAPVMLVPTDPYGEQHPLNVGREQENRMEYRCSHLQTFMNSKQLSFFFALPKKEKVGYYVDAYVQFDCMMRKKTEGQKLRVGKIIEAGGQAQPNIENWYEISLNDLNRHALVIGATGGGKTNSMKALLGEIWRKNRVPFLVIESAKREYIELLQVCSDPECSQSFDTLCLFTLGNETAEGIPYRINPFEVMPHISLQAHIDYLLSTFNASFDMVAPMPYILERAVYEVYQDKGWDLYTNRNRRGLKEYPTLSQLYYKIDVVTDRLGYDDEVKANVREALKTRVNSLRIGGKGALLDVARSVPLSRLLGGPCVFELEDIGDDDIKAFVIGILLVQLYEYRKSCGSNEKLQGVLVIEEAHRLLKNVSEAEGGGMRSKSVEFFCNMLAEIRSFGQGIIIADQIPTKLAADTIKNTNLKVVHRTVMEDDRECIGAAMNMTPEQKDYLSCLSRGCAAVYSEGDNRPKLVKMPLVQTKQQKTRAEMVENIRARVNEKFQDCYNVCQGSFAACRYCEERKCPSAQWYERVWAFRPEDYRSTLQKSGFSLNSLLDLLYTYKTQTGVSFQENWEEYCTLGCMLERMGLSEEKQAELSVKYLLKKYPWREDRREMFETEQGFRWGQES